MPQRPTPRASGARRHRALRCVVALLAAGAATGCGNTSSTTINGRSALLLTGPGSVTALIDVCHGSVDRVDIAGPNPDDGRENPKLGLLTADAPQSGRLRVDLTAPTSPWRAEPALRYPTDPTALFIVSATNHSDDSQVSQVSSTPQALQKLTPGQVIRADGDVVSEADFHAQACAGSS